MCFAVYPSGDTEIIQSGDALRLGFYLVLLVGAEREIDRYWSRLADVAIYEERRRLARDLHDGVAQELAYVVTQTRLLVRGRAAPGTDERVAAAAERALDESRRAIIALTLRDDEPLHLALARAAEDVAGRVGVEVDVDVQTPVDRTVSSELREALVRIVQESVSNAGRHGHATRVRITMGPEGVLRITDDGAGFDPGDAGDGRFGLVSMRERAESLGARFTIDSEPGRGTSVEVALR
jgi:signal transduction histidine kinase